MHHPSACWAVSTTTFQARQHRPAFHSPVRGLPSLHSWLMPEITLPREKERLQSRTLASSTEAVQVGSNDSVRLQIPPTAPSLRLNLNPPIPHIISLKKLDRSFWRHVRTCWYSYRALRALYILLTLVFTLFTAWCWTSGTSCPCPAGSDADNCKLVSFPASFNVDLSLHDKQLYKSFT